MFNFSSLTHTVHISVMRFQYRVSYAVLVSRARVGGEYLPDYLPAPSSQCLKYFWTVAVGG